MIKNLYTHYTFSYSEVASKLEGGAKLDLKEAREAANFTQQEVADLLHVSRPTYVSMEQDPSKIRMGTAKEIARILNVSVDDIFFAKRDS